jgi:hypothetical protein
LSSFTISFPKRFFLTTYLFLLFFYFYPLFTLPFFSSR